MAYANSADPDHTAPKEQSDQGLQYRTKQLTQTHCCAGPPLNYFYVIDHCGCQGWDRGESYTEKTLAQYLSVQVLCSLIWDHQGNQETEIYTLFEVKLNPSLAEHDMPGLSKQCRSRSEEAN